MRSSNVFLPRDAGSDAMMENARELKLRTFARLRVFEAAQGRNIFEGMIFEQVRTMLHHETGPHAALQPGDISGRTEM